MSEPEIDLIPEELLERALAPERPDAGAFEDGVAERIAERARLEAEAAAARPTWIRRAAAILPPGVVDLAVMGKFGGTAKGLPGLTWLAAPWALLAVGVAGLVGAMALTARLDGTLGADLEDERLRRRLRRGPLPVLVVLLLLTPLIALGWAVLEQNWAAVMALFLIAAAAIVATTIALSRARVANRPTVASMVSMAISQLLMLSVVIPGIVPDVGPLTRLGLPSVLMGTQAAVLLQTRQRCREYRWLGVGFLGLAALGFPLLQVAIQERPFGATRAELVDWVERCDGTEGRLRVWEEFGYAVAVLGTEGLDLSTPLAALTALDEPPVLPALRSGLVPAAELGRAARPAVLIENEFAGGVYRFRSPDDRFAELSVLRARGELGPDRLAIARASLDDWVPEVGDWGVLEDAWYLTECARLLEDAGFVERHRERLHALLVHHWDDEGRRRKPAGGFASWLEDDDGTRRRHANTEDSLFGVLLMERAGVPDGIDSRQLDRYLSHELASHDSAQPHPYDIQAAVARLALRRYAPAAGRGLGERVVDEATFLAALALCLLCLWVVRRAPDAERGFAV